jgi:RNA-directed DNA polymerase
MKRHGNLFDKIVDMDNLYKAYYNARRGKRWQRAVIKFNEDIEGNLIGIRDSLVGKTFTTSPYKTKFIHEPKLREIYILPFSPDRIVQHAIMNVIEPIWEGLFIYDSYACRVGKGIHAGSRRAMEFIRKNQYCMQCDIAKFYPSIDHEILFNIIKKKIKCKDTLDLLYDIIVSIPGVKNVPIGNYTSQWFGNLYMNELDQYLKKECGAKCYIRYCDDFIVFSNYKEELNSLAGKIEEFLDSKLKLSLKKCSIFPVSQGLDFLGYRHFKDYILLRKSTAKRVVKRLRKLPRELDRGNITKDQLRSSLASTQGWLRWANTHNLQLSLKMDKLRELYIEEV